MNKALLFRLHRWTTLIFAAPLTVLIATGLILSFEPVATTAGAGPGSIDAARLTALLERHDPDGRARGIALRGYADEFVISGIDRGPRVVGLATGSIRDASSALATVFAASRTIHEHLVLGLDWLVVPSTLAMLGVIVLGAMMGLPVLRNTVGGWHKATGWFLLPLVVVSPLTGLMLAWNITLAAPAPAESAAPSVSIAEAVRVVAAEHDLGGLLWIRRRGTAMIARVVVDGEYRAYVVHRDGLEAQPRNWPRLIHEGAWSGAVSAALNIVTSIALIGLLGTGLFMWTRRRLRRGRSRPAVAARA